jgi:hypothetical protein
MRNETEYTNGGAKAPKTRNWGRLAAGAVALSLMVATGACGGGGDDSADRAPASTEVAGGTIDDANRSNTTQRIVVAGENVSANNAPGVIGDQGAVNFGETYTVELLSTASEGTITFPAGSIMNIEATAPASNQRGVAIELRGSDGISLFLQAQPGATEMGPEPVVTPAGDDVETTVILNGAPGDVVTFELTSAEQTEGGGDAGENAGVANPVESGATIEGIMGGLDQADYLALDVQNGSVIEVDVAKDAASSGGTWAKLIYNGENRGSVSVQPGGETTLRKVVGASETGEWFVELTGGGTYTVTPTVTSQDDGGSGDDAGDDAASATAAEPGTIEGVLGDNDDADFYVFDLEPGQALDVEITASPEARGATYAEPAYNGRATAYATAQPGGTGTVSHVFSADESGDLIVEVSGGDVAYEMVVTLDGQNDADSGGDAGADSGAAVLVQDNSTFEGRLGNNDADDYYSFVAEETGVTTVSIQNDADSGNGYVTPFINGSQKAYASASAGGVGEVELETVEGELVHLEVTSVKGSYTVVIGSGENTPQPDEDLEIDELGDEDSDDLLDELSDLVTDDTEAEGDDG